MRSTRFFISAVLVAFLIVCVNSGCGRKDRAPKGKMLVAASIGPLGNFAREVGGNLVDVEVMVPASANPHTYQLSTEQMELLSNASVLVLNGVGLEFWADKAIGAVDNPNLIIIQVAKGLPVLGNNDTDHPGGNPHQWLNPILAIREVLTIRDSFIKADPKHKKTYEANAAKYIDKLKQLDKYIRARVKTFKSRDFISFHPSWIYFAREYGLNEAANIEKSPGQEPSPSDMADVLKVCKRVKAKAIFAEPQFSPKAAQVIASECGAKVLMLNTMGEPPDYNYIDSMHKNIDEMTKALQ